MFHTSDGGKTWEIKNRWLQIYVLSPPQIPRENLSEPDNLKVLPNNQFWVLSRLHAFFHLGYIKRFRSSTLKTSPKTLKHLAQLGYVEVDSDHWARITPQGRIKYEYEYWRRASKR